MTGLKTLVAAALISTVSATAALAQQEPAAFQAAYPNRDVLNGGQLTPEGRMALERSGNGPATSNAYAGMDGPSPTLRTPRARHRKVRPAN